MTNITVFGKPRAFESYDYVFGGEFSQSAENIHREPILKPKSYEDSVLHYFVKDNMVGLECYKRARGFESDRYGIVFGVAIKSTTDFNIIETLSNVLIPFWSDFASAFLDGTNRFNLPSIIGPLSDTKWSQEEISRVQNASNGKPILLPKKGLLLLVTTDMNSVSTVEHILKEYSDVYISNNIEIFQDPINEVVLKQTNKQIYTIVNGTLKLIEERGAPQLVQNHQPPKNGNHLFGWLSKPIKTGMADVEQPSLVTKGRNMPKNLKWIIAAGICLIIGSSIVILRPTAADGNKTNIGKESPGSDDHNGGMFGKSGDIPEPGLGEGDIPCDATSVIFTPCNTRIKKSWKLEPKIEPQSSSNVPMDLVFDVSDHSLVKIDDQYRLKVIRRPSDDTEIIVTASINGKVLGEQAYIIAKEDAPKEVSNQKGSKIPQYKGKSRTLKQYLADLEKGLENGSLTPKFVREECQKIINGAYGEAFKNNNDAIRLRKKAKNTKIEPKF